MSVEIVEKPWKEYKSVYTFTYTLPGSKEEIKYKPITMKEIKQILLYENASPDEIDKALDDMITSCVIEPSDFDINKLYLQDRFALMIELKIRSEGSTYEFDITCPKCGSQSHQVLNLGELECTTKNKQLMDCELKIDKNFSIFIDAITREDQIEIENLQKDKEYKILKDQLSEKIFLGLVKSIKKVKFKNQEYDVNFQDALEIVDTLSKEKFKELTDLYNSLDFGVNFIRKIKCPHFIMEEDKQVPCGYEEDFRIPVESFFVS